MFQAETESIDSLEKSLDFFAGQETMNFMPHIFSVADWLQ